MYHYNIDKLTIRDGLLFGWGWFVDESLSGFPVELVLSHEDGSKSKAICLRSGRRDDVGSAFPQIRHAAASGFLIQGRLSSTSTISTAKLILESVETNTVRDLIDLPNIDQVLSSHVSQSATRISRALRKYGLIGTARVCIVRASIAAWRVINKISFRPATTQGATLIVDHNLGGGANVFRSQLVSRLQRSGSVFVLIPRVQTLDYEVKTHTADGKSSTVYRNLDDVLAFLDKAKWSRIIVNELVSYPEPLKLVKWLKDHLTSPHKPAEAILYLHDFYAVCPQWTLVGSSGVFCGIPDARTCSACMKKLRVPFLAYLISHSVQEWRRQWLPLLELCDVRAFSDSTVNLIRKAFPELESKKIRVDPHSTDYFTPRVVDFSRNPSDFRIGVVGHINGPKGAAVIENAAERIRTLGLPLSIVVIGSLESTRADDRIIHAGAFTPETLAEKLEEHAVNACWVPSVCPETYSFVTSELIALGVPITCFDVGAPAERVSKYVRGRVIKNFDVGAVLDHFLEMRTEHIAKRGGPSSRTPETPHKKAKFS